MKPSRAAYFHPIRLSVLCLCLGLIPNGQAALRTWIGGGADFTWTNVLNWDGAAPVSGDDLVFSGSTRLNSSNNISGLKLNSITYNASGFTNNGLALSITNGIVDNAGGNTNIIPLTIGAASGFTNFVFGSTLVLNGTIANGGFPLTVGGDGNIFLGGVISGAGSLSMNGNGLLRLGAANTFSNANGLTINSGTVRLGNGAAIPTGNGFGNLNIASGATLDLGANSQTINGLSGAGVVDEASTNAATYTLTVGNANSNAVFSGTIQDTYGIVALTKTGTGTQTLAGANSYVGQTIINGGTLALATGGSLASTNITIFPGSVFDVFGAGGFTLNGNLFGGRSTGFANDLIGGLTLIGGNITPVAGSAGTLTINGNLTLIGGTLNFDLNNVATVGGGTNDLIAVNGGTVDLSSGTTAIKLNPIAGSLNGTYTLISSTNPIVGSAANLSFDAPRGLTVAFDTTTQPSNVLMTASGSPNPSTLVWAGNSAGGSWDVHTSQTWLSNGVPDFFYDLDSVIFNDAAGSANGLVAMPNAVSPSSVIINNSAFNYTIGTAGADPGLISGTGSLTKTGTGTVTLNTANSFTGDTTVNGGTLVLGTSLASPNFIVYNGVAPGNLILGGGNVFMTDAANITYRANFNNLTLNPGGGSLGERNRQSSSSYIFQFGSITRNVGGTVDFGNIQQKASSPQVGLLITNAPAVNGILGGWATIFELDWVVPVATGLGSIGYVGYQTNNATPSAWGAVSNVAVTATPGANLNNTVINSLKLVGASTVTINPGQTLTLASGGLLVPNAGAAATITGGTLQGATNADLVVFQHSAVGALTVGAIIADNTNNAAAGGSALTKAGTGTLILTGNNTYSGPTYVNGPTVTGGSGTGPTAIAAGTLQIGSGGTAGGISNSPAVANNGTLAFNRSDTIGYAGIISGFGGVKQQGAGTTVFTADSTYSGATTIAAGTLQIGNGGTTGSFSNSTSVANGGALVFNRTGTLKYSGTISGLGSLAIQGGATVILATNETYAGSTTVSAGALVLGATGSISNSVLISVNAGAAFDGSAAGGVILNGAGAGQVLAGNGGVTGNVTAGSNTRISPGGDSVIGTLTLNNNLTLSGGAVTTEINGGSRDLLVVTGGLNLASGTIALNNLGGAIPNGSYKLIGYSGALTGSAANLVVSGFSQAGQLASLSSAITGEIDLVVSSGAGSSLTWTGDGGNNFWDVNISSAWNNGAGASVFHNGDSVVFNDTGAANPIVNLNGSVAPASIVVGSTTDYTFGGGGKVSGGASLTKNGTATLSILTTNDNSGPTIINGGTLRVGNGTVSGAIGSGNLSNNAALVFNEADDRTVSGNLSGSGSLIQQGATTLILSGNNTAFSGGVTIAAGTLQIGAGGASGTLGTGPATNNGALVINRSGTLTYSGTISGSGPVSNLGPGIVTLSGANSYAGDTVIANGTIKAGSGGTLPSGPGFGNVVLDGGASVAGVLDLNGFNVSVNGLAGTNGTVLAQIVNNSGTVANTLTFGNGDGTNSFSGTIRDNSGGGGKVGLIKIGAGTQTIDIPNALGNLFTGGTILSNGILAITSPGGSSPVNLGANAVALGSGPVTFYGGTLSMAGSLGQNTTPTFFPGMANTFIIPTNQSGTVNPPQRGICSSPLIGSGTLFYNPAYVRGELGGDWSAFTGLIVLAGAANGGQLGLDTASGFPNARVYMTTNVTLYGRMTGTPTIPIGELAGGDDSDSLVSTSPSNAGGLAASFMIGGLNTSTNFNGRILDTVGIIKVGTGTLTLTNVNMTYTGQTTVSNGILIFTGALPPSSTFGLASPGVLDVSAPGLGLLSVGVSVAQTIQGNGTLLGSLAVGGLGTVLPGFTNRIGTLTVTNDVNLAGETFMELNRTNVVGGTNDQIASATITLGGDLTVTNLGPPLKVGDTFKLIKAGALNGSFGNVNLPATDASGYLYTWTDNTATNGTITVLTSVSTVNTTPTNITAVLTGSTLTLSWPTDRVGWRLLVQTNNLLSGISSNTNDWDTVAGSTATNQVSLTIQPVKPTEFYKLVYP